MKTSTALVLCGIIAIAVAAYTLMVYSSLPDTIPTHWGADGTVNGYGSRGTIFIMPGVTLSLTLLLLALPWMSPKNFKIDTFRETYNYMMFIVTAMMGYLSFVIIYMTLHPTWDFTKPMIGGMLIFFALLGNSMGKVKRNFFMGIRTPWTLASDQVWVATHRLGARLMTLGGAAGAVAVLLGAPVLPVFFVFLALVLYPVLYSLLLYKRLEKAGAL